MQLPSRQSQYDHSSIANLYQRHGPALLKYIRRHVPIREDAEDVLLEVFVAALESETLRTLDEGEQLAWLRRVAHNKFVDHNRRVYHRPIVPLEETSETLYEDDDLAPEQMTLRREAHARLRRHLSSLPELQREVLRLRFANGLRCAEIARHLNKNEGAVRTLLSRSLNLLRGIYEKNREDTQHG